MQTDTFLANIGFSQLNKTEKRKKQSLKNSSQSSHTNNSLQQVFLLRYCETSDCRTGFKLTSKADMHLLAALII